MLEINYEKLEKKYKTELLTKTRAFNTEEDHLKFWVPSVDKVESILNLIDSLKESNEFNFKITLSKLFFNKENINKLNLIFNSISKYHYTEDKNNYIYTFEINKDELNEFFSKKTKFVAKKLKENYKEVKFVPEIFAKETIKNYYINEIINFNFEKYKNFFESDISFKNETGNTYKFFSSDISNYKLTLKLSTPNLFICDFSFEKNKNSNHDLKWLDNFFRIVRKIIENRPLREVKDHASIYLIDILRPKNIKYQGIIHSDNEGKIFYDLKLFFASAYQSLIKNEDGLNKYYKSLSSSWKNFTDKKKIEILNKELEKFCYENNFSNKDLTINKIESNFKIILNMSSDFASKQKTKHYLLQLEEIIRINVDFRLEVFISMRHDTNKLRVGKSFKSD